MKKKEAPTGKRLKEARIAAGYPSASAVARLFGWVASTYHSHERGVFEFDPARAQEYAKAFGVSAGWLLTGQQEQSQNDHVVTLIGNVAPGGLIVAPEDEYRPGWVVEARLAVNIPGAKFAVHVKGRDLFPKYDPGTVLVCRDPLTNPEPYIGKECAVYLTDGNVYLRTLEHGSAPGLYDLRSFSQETVRDVRIVNASKVCAIIPAEEWERLEREGHVREFLGMPPVPTKLSA